ncbi:hypothetical protein Aple_021900 [Acrocarpospora pleiomorpha]|uniref:Core-binding (CB) domain-containing protein n=1 Tax=Acrocarpospora pleiomorpha TaxID=90975 RepID=A0A5M3XDG9_9ACTN|nr:hypothetical protein Aple_021900 [Acrocarpospora pleiomorpha]
MPQHAKRDQAEGEMQEALRWLAANTKPVSALTEPATMRALLDAATSKVDGKRSAPSTVRKHRMLISNALDYAVELELLEENPLHKLKWKLPKSSHEVDRKSVVNHAQARALLEAVGSEAEREASGYVLRRDLLRGAAAGRGGQSETP